MYICGRKAYGRSTPPLPFRKPGVMPICHWWTREMSVVTTRRQWGRQQSPHLAAGWHQKAGGPHHRPSILKAAPFRSESSRCSDLTSPSPDRQPRARNHAHHVPIWDDSDGITQFIRMRLGHRNWSTVSYRVARNGGPCFADEAGTTAKRPLTG